MTLSFTPSGIRVVERCTRYIDVSAENGGQALGDVELSSTKGAGAAGNADVVIVKKPEKKKGWSFTTWLLVISVGLGIVGGLGYYGSTILFASSSDSSTTNAESPAPPAPPGASYVPAVRLTTVVAGTVADLDQNAYKNNLAGLLGADVQASDITLVVSAGSVVVEAIITTDTDAGADSIMSNLNQYDQTTLGQALQVTIEQAPTTGKTRGVKIYPPPSPPPHPPDPSTPPTPPPTRRSQRSKHMSNPSLKRGERESDRGAMVWHSRGASETEVRECGR